MYVFIKKIDYMYKDLKDYLTIYIIVNEHVRSI